MTRNDTVTTIAELQSPSTSADIPGLSASAFPPPPVVDGGRTRLTGFASIRDASGVIADKGRVQLGGHAPLFAPREIADHGRVHLGGHSPIF